MDTLFSFLVGLMMKMGIMRKDDDDPDDGVWWWYGMASLGIKIVWQQYNNKKKTREIKNA